MPSTYDFDAVFTRLKALLAPYAPSLTVEADTADSFSLNAAYDTRIKRPLFFGAVQVKKNYVSFYLMPVYVFPDLLDGMSPALQKRMQGKSCFNFKTVDEPLFAELAALTRNGFVRFQANGML